MAKKVKYVVTVVTALTCEVPLDKGLLKGAVKLLKESNSAMIVEDAGLPPSIIAKTKSVTIEPIA